MKNVDNRFFINRKGASCHNCQWIKKVYSKKSTNLKTIKTSSSKSLGNITLSMNEIRSSWILVASLLCFSSFTRLIASNTSSKWWLKSLNSLSAKSIRARWNGAFLIISFTSVWILFKTSKNFSNGLNLSSSLYWNFLKVLLLKGSFSKSMEYRYEIISTYYETMPANEAVFWSLHLLGYTDFVSTEQNFICAWKI